MGAFGSAVTTSAARRSAWPGRRAGAALALQLAAALPLAAVATAGSAREACACGGWGGYSLYQPFTDLATLVDRDGEGDEGIGSPIYAPNAFRYAFVAPWVVADSAAGRTAEGAALARVWTERFTWSGADSAGPAALSDAAFTAALRAGALDRAAELARAEVEASLERPANEAQEEQGVVRRAVEFLELRPVVASTPGPLLARFFAAAPPPDAPRPFRVVYGPDSAASRARIAAWERRQRLLGVGPLPAESLPPVLRAAAALRALPRPALAAAGARAVPDGADAASQVARLRRPSLRYVALDQRTRALVPDGWPDADSLRLHAPAFRALRRDYEAWLAEYPGHPLAPLVRLGTVRVDRFALDTGRAWATLLDEYGRDGGRRRARVVAEMNHLLAVDAGPPAAVVAAAARSGDPLLRSAFLFRALGCQSFACSAGVAGYPRGAWDAAWRAAEAARRAPASAGWAVNAQERLLRIALADTTGGPLPSAFPARAEVPTPLWGLSRLALLVRAGRWADAEAQAALLPRGRAAAGLRARLALRRGLWSRALGEAELDAGTRRYFVAVLAPDSVLAALAASPDTGVRAEAVRAQAARLAGGAGDWRRAARLVAEVDPARAAALDSAAPLAADTTPAGRLAWAGFLVAHQEALLGGADEREWYRALDDRWDALGGTRARSGVPAAVPGVPWTPPAERAAVRRFLRENSELYLALRAYGAAVAAMPPGPARVAARAGDVPYNRLRNRNYEYTVFWRRELAGEPAVAALRRAGR